MYNKWKFYFAVVLAVAGLSACEPDPAITVTGEFYHHTDAETIDLMGDTVCFAPDEPSAKKFPSTAGTQDLWFCFDSTPDAKKAFDIPEKDSKALCKYSGAATIRISGYQPAKREGDADWNTARLEAVLAKEPPQAALCGEK